MRLFNSVSVIACTLLVTASVARGAAAPVKAYMSIGVQSAVEAVIPEFEQAAGQRIVATWATSATLDKRLRAGEAADVLISTRGGIDALISEGKVSPGTRVDIASSVVALAVRTGDARPDISTPDALKRTLLAARSISYSDPAAGGTSGVHFAKVLEQLGIAEAMRARTRFPPPSGFAASLLATGEVDLAVQQTQELASVPGVQVVGPLPSELQLVTTFAAGIPTSSSQPAAASAFVRFLQSPRAQTVMKEKGLQPAASPTAAATTDVAAMRAALAPTGTLRAAFLSTNPVQGRIDPRSGAVTGPVQDLTEALAARLSVPYVLVAVPDARAVIDTLHDGKADIGYLAIDANRAKEVDFVGSYAVMRSSYVVSANSPLKESTGLDREGVVIGAVKGVSQQLFASSFYKKAQVRIFAEQPTRAELEALLGSGELTAFGMNRQRALDFAKESTQLRALEDSFFDVPQAFAINKDQAARYAILDAFAADIRRSGFVASSLAKAGLQQSVGVAP
jgi:molybdate transport system substrate-binding protein